MIKRRTPFVGAAFLTLFAANIQVEAAPALRTQVDQHGDFLLIGNTLGYDCYGEPPAPVVGDYNSGDCAPGANTTDSSPDLFWRADDPEAGRALADVDVGPTTARTTAALTVPNGATVTHAYLYWAASKSTGGTANAGQVTVERLGTAGFQQTLNAVTTYTVSSTNAYESVADVTSLVQQYSSGAYRVSNIAVPPFANVDDNTVFGAWAMVVFYRRATDPLRNLALFDGMDFVSPGANQSVTLSGFVVPLVGFDGKLGVVAYEGDTTLGGDQVFFNGGAALGDALNPPDNFFNATRSWLGSPISVNGDLPRLTGASRSMSGVDLDVVDITSKLTPGQTSAPVQATSNGDEYYLGAFVTSVTNFKPDFTTSTKTVRDVNGGNILAGDTLEYTLTAKNTGNDAAVHSVIRDPLPNGVTYVPNSLTILSGANLGPKTDTTGDDQAEFVSSARTVVAWLGTDAKANSGGTIPINGSTVVSFRVTIDAGFSGPLANQGTITAGGQLGTPDTHTVTDGNGVIEGTPPTEIGVDECDTNEQCTGDEPACDTSVLPRVCVTCVQDSDCGSGESGKVCLANQTCVDGCRGAGGNGCPDGDVCTSDDDTVGTCVGCVTDADCGTKTSGKVCDTSTQTCRTGCRGKGGNGCPKTDICTSDDTAIGDCSAKENNGGAGGQGGQGGAEHTTSSNGDLVAQGNGCSCRVPSGRSNRGVALLMGMAAAVFVLVRRRRRNA